MTSKYLAKGLTAMGAALIALALFAPGASALTETAPGYERFGGCPTFEEEILAAEICSRTEIYGGHFQMGSKDVPITVPITLVGGLTENGEVHFNSRGGLSKSKEKIPGGIVGLTGLEFLTELLTGDALNVYAVTELAGTPILSEGGKNVELPIKVHLENAALGKNCYVGSNSSPIKLHLTWGTTSPPPPNTPITGKEPVPGKSSLAEVILFEKGLYVDNAFAAPAAKGCVLTVLGLLPVNIDSLVNTQSGLPSAAGHNETKQEFNLEIVPGFGVVYP